MAFYSATETATKSTILQEYIELYREYNPDIENVMAIDNAAVVNDKRMLNGSYVF